MGEPRVWVVDSGYTGELNARLGVAERLGCGYEILPLPNGDPGAYREMLLRRLIDGGLPGEPPPIVLLSGTGEEMTAEIADLKAVIPTRLLNVYLASILPEELHPRLFDYDLIASPQISGPKVVSTLGIPHRVGPRTLADAAAACGYRFERLRRPLIGVLVGGNTRYCFGFDEAHARGLARRVKRLARSLGGTVILANSRRTPGDAWSAIIDELDDPEPHLIDWQRGDRETYLALLATADVFVVTGDSLSMCSEASATGKPLLVDFSVATTESFHREILAKLLDHGAARLLGDHYDPWTYVPPDPAGSVADAIWARLGQCSAH